MTTTRASPLPGRRSDSMNTTQDTVIKGAQNDDTAAWEQLHNLYQPLLRKYARKYGLSREDAEDIAATCWVTIVEKIKTYEKCKGRFRAWLKTLVDRRAIDLLRKRREKQADSGVFDGKIDPAPLPDEVWEALWKNQHLKYCVEQVRLEADQRQFEAFEMLVLKARTVEEVCEELGLTANQVYKAKSRYLRRVRQKMTEVGYDVEL